MTRLNEDILHELAELPKLGILSLKMFMAYNGRLRLQDGEIFQVMRHSAKHNLLPMLHAENGDVIDILVKEALAENLRAPIWHARTRPAWGATEAALRGISLSVQAQSPLYIVHVNTAGEVDQLAYAHQHGIGVLGELAPPIFSSPKKS
jgi:dihydropyrimidinase